ncbi:MAG: hypothetical protein ABJA74_05320 [Lapillicoccus sp.]
MDYDPDAVRQGYAMGWIREEYKDGSSLVWHNGGIDGFTSYIEFLPQPDLGLVLNTMNPSPTGKWFYAYVLNVLLNQRLSLNLAVPGKALAANASAFDQLRQLSRQAKTVDLGKVDRYFGNYESGYSLVRDGRDVQLRIGPRVLPLQGLPDRQLRDGRRPSRQYARQARHRERRGAACRGRWPGDRASSHRVVAPRHRQSVTVTRIRPRRTRSPPC